MAKDGIFRRAARKRGALPPGRCFQLCGCSGLAAALASAVYLSQLRHLSWPIVIAMWVTSVAGFLTVAMASKIVTGAERLVYYHHEIAIVLIVAAFLQLLRVPGTPYLDLEAEGLGAFLAFGRVGCLLAGCCYGRPSTRGVRYRRVHVDAGFPDYLEGVRLLPVQAIESCVVLALVCGAFVMISSQSPPGTAFAFYIPSYALTRFLLEFLRGDPERPYWWGFSEAQWTSLIVAGTTAVFEWRGRLPRSPYAPAATLTIAAAMAGVALRRRLRRTAWDCLLHPGHIQELAQAIAEPQRADSINIRATSLGIRISGGRIRSRGVNLRHFTLSGGAPPLDSSSASRLADLIRCLSRTQGVTRLIPGKTAAVFHLLIEDRAEIEHLKSAVE